MSVQRCCHVKMNGARCTMPAVNGNQFCYQHGTLRTLKRMRPMPTPPKWLSTPLFSLRYPETYDDLVFNAHLALDAFVRHDIDFRQLTTVTHQIEVVRKCMAAAERHNKLQGRLNKEVLVTELRPDPEQEGGLLAFPDSPSAPQPAQELASPALPEVQPNPAPCADPVPDPPAESAPEPAILPTLTACAEPEPTPRTSKQTTYLPLFHTPARKLLITPLFPTLAKHKK